MARPGNGGPPAEDKSFWEHLEDLRRTLIKCLAAVALAAAAAFLFADRLLEAVRWPLARMAAAAGWENGPALRSLSPAEAFLTSLQLSLLAGLVAALPLVLYFCAGFIFPALTRKEKKSLGPAFAAGGVLFYLGAAFAFFAVLPLSLRFFWLYTQRLGVIPEWTLRHYAALAGRTALAFGLAFELPLVLVLLARMKLVGLGQLKRQRPMAVVAATALAALLTPPDIISQVLLAVPLIGLFELSLWAVRLLGEKKDEISAESGRSSAGP